MVWSTVASKHRLAEIKLANVKDKKRKAQKIKSWLTFTPTVSHCTWCTIWFFFYFLAIIHFKQMGSPGVGLFFRYFRLIPEFILSGSPRSVTLSQMWKANWSELCRHGECGSQAESSPVGDTAHRSHSSGGVYRKGCIEHNTAKRSNVCEQSSSSRTIPSSLPLSPCFSLFASADCSLPPLLFSRETRLTYWRLKGICLAHQVWIVLLLFWTALL